MYLPGNPTPIRPPFCFEGLTTLKTFGPPGGTGGLSSYTTSVARGDYLYNFGVGHTMNAAIAGAAFETHLSECPFGSGLGSGPINWTVATQRVDVTSIGVSSRKLNAALAMSSRVALWVRGLGLDADGSV